MYYEFSPQKCLFYLIGIAATKKSESEYALLVMKSMNLSSFLNCIWDEKAWILNILIKLTSLRYEDCRFYNYFDLLEKIVFEEHVLRVLNNYGRFILAYKQKLEKILENSLENNYRMILAFCYQIYKNPKESLRTF